MPANQRQNRTIAGLRFVAVLVMIGAITLVCSRMLPVNSTTTGFLYLVAILLVAANWGLAEAIVSSLAAVLCFNYYFLPPLGTFTIADPQNWVALFAFLATSIIASHLSTQAKNRAVEALNRQGELEKLYALSRSILLVDISQPVAKQLAHVLAQTFDAQSVILHDRTTGEIHRAGPEDWQGHDDQLRQAAVQGTLFQNAEERTVITAIRLGMNPIGSLGIRGVDLSDSALQSLANLVAIGLERTRSQETSSRAEAARQSDELKSTLLDAIAHEFKTPLTSIKAASTSLLSEHQPALEQQRELISIVDEEADRLSTLVTEAIQMARIESGRVRMKRERCAVRDLVARVMEKIKPAIEDRPVQVTVPPGIPPVWVDRELIELALRQLLDNALKYSPPASLLSVTAQAEEGGVRVSVSDQGAGIGEAEQEKIFDKFYRSSSSGKQVSGAGLGLAIARDIVQAHGGRIWVESRPGSGSAFQFTLPLAGVDETA